MQKNVNGICIIFLCIGIIVLSATGLFVPEETKKTEYLRIHIRANSNLDCDQSVKYLVRNELVDFLTPYLSECETKNEAQSTLASLCGPLKSVADRVLQENGFSYKSKATVREEDFPARTYNGLTLESGCYSALIVELGEAEGDNWWCVAYPPLCFTESNARYEYKSKIAEIIKNFFNKD